MSDAANGAERPQTGLVAFHFADFRNYFLGRSLSRFASDMQSTAIGWQVYNLTGSAFDLGAVGLVQIIPFLLLFPLAGVAADRFRRARVMACCISGQVLCSTALLTMTLSGTENFPVILLIMSVSGFLRSFQLPAEQSLIPLAVPREHFANAVAWTASGNQIARIAGPSVAGLLIALGEPLVYAVVVALSFASFTFIMLIRANTQIVSRDPLSLATVFAGVRFIWKREVMLGIIVMDLFVVLLASATALLPIFAKDILQVGSVGFGLLRSAITVGAFAGSLTFTQTPIKTHAGIKLYAATAIYGASSVLFGFSHFYWLSFLALFVLGFSDSVSIFIRNNVITVISPDDMRGRVNAVNSVFIGTSNQMGEFWSGITASLLGAGPAVIFGGLGTICVVLLFARLFPKLFRLDSLDPDELVRKYQ